MYNENNQTNILYQLAAIVLPFVVSLLQIAVLALLRISWKTIQELKQEAKDYRNEFNKSLKEYISMHIREHEAIANILQDLKKCEGDMKVTIARIETTLRFMNDDDKDDIKF